MAQRFYFFIFFTLLLSCTQKEDTNTICPQLRCATPSQSLRLKIVDAKSNIDLIFNQGRKLSDLRIYSFRLKNNIDFNVDSTDKNNPYVVFNTSISDEFKVSLGDLPPDTVKVETRFVNEDCCGRLEITSLSANKSLQPLGFNSVLSNIIIIKK